MFRLLRASNLCEHQTRVVFGLKLMIGGASHKVVVEKGRLRLYYIDID